MLTNFFSKSKPINFILVSTYLIAGCFFSSISLLDETVGFSFFQKQTLLLLVCVFSVLLLNFIVRKNNLTENNTYSIFFFACFMLLIPLVFNNLEVLAVNVLLLLVFRRVLSLTSEKNMEKKILDASLWITVATLFYFWCILFFIVLFIAIIQQRSKNYKLILIPFVGFLSILVLVTSYNLIQGISFLWILNIDRSISLDFQAYHKSSLIIPISILAIVLILTFFQKVISFSDIRLKEKSNAILLILILLICVTSIILIPIKNGSEFLYLMAPLAILTANFIEKLHTLWIKEVILWLALISPIIIAFL